MPLILSFNWCKNETIIFRVFQRYQLNFQTKYFHGIPLNLILFQATPKFSYGENRNCWRLGYNTAQHSINESACGILYSLNDFFFYQVCLVSGWRSKKMWKVYIRFDRMYFAYDIQIRLVNFNYIFRKLCF